MKQIVYIVNAFPYYPIEVFANFVDAQKHLEKIANDEGWEYNKTDDSYVMSNNRISRVQMTEVK